MLKNIISWLGSIPADKALHFAVSTVVAMLSMATAALCGATPFWVVVTSFIIVTALGIAKEYILDSEPDPWDLVANYSGAAVVWVVYCIATGTA